MEYITVQQAAENWGYSIRQVQNLCIQGKIPGATRFSRAWAIPKDAARPADGRRRQKPGQQDNLASAFQANSGNEELLFQLVDLFPIPIEVFAPDGTTVFANRACYEAWNVSPTEPIIGRYNILQDPVVNDVLGLRDYVKRAFEGETLCVSDVKVPLDDMASRYKAAENPVDVFALYNDISSFPIWDKEHKIAYIVNVFITKSLYQGRPDIARAKEYMNLHWYGEFDLDKIAEAANLSTYHFAHLFRKHTGDTPYSYYKNIKVEKLKEKLLDSGVSIAEVFAACGVDYKGSFARIFRETVGMSPSEYRESVKNLSRAKTSKLP